MKAKKILFITQEITPYVPDTQISAMGRELPQSFQEKNREIRTFMPKWGIVNERRNQLHEVIRLSGMNLIIDDTDHPLIIKVASIPSARIQVYFIDNDEYFGHRQMAIDAKGREYKDNSERAVFYARGVLETVKKLRWTPEIIHCQGWISSIIPLYLKTAYAEEPAFRDCRTIFTPTNFELKANLGKNFPNVLQYRNADITLIEQLGPKLNMQSLNKIGTLFSDGICMPESNPEIEAFAKSHKKPLLISNDFGKENPAILDFFDVVWSKGKKEIVEED